MSVPTLEWTGSVLGTVYIVPKAELPDEIGLDELIELQKLAGDPEAYVTTALKLMEVKRVLGGGRVIAAKIGEPEDFG